MGISVKLPEMNIKEDEIKLLLAIKLLEEEKVSLGKAAEIAGYTERAFVEMLVHRGVAPIKYTNLDLDTELRKGSMSVVRGQLFVVKKRGLRI
jgi:predicted HTH domain antitoxin